MPDTIEERLRKLRAQRSGQSIEERLANLRAQKQQPTRQPEGVFSSFQTGVAGPLLRNVVETAADLYNAPGETLERAGRAGLEFVSAFDPAGAAYEPTKQGQAERVAELNRRADERLPEPIQSMKQGMAIEEAKPRTRAGRIAGVAGSILGEVAFPTAPETAVANIVTAPFAGAAAKGAGRAFKAGVNAVRRTFGKGAAQIIEAEALPAARAQVQQSLQGAVPATERAAVRAETGPAAVEAPAPISTPGPTGKSAPSVQQAIKQYEEAVDRISRSNLSPEEKGKALEQAIESIARSRRPGVDLGPNESMVQSRYPRQKGAPPMVMPDNPNPIQQRGNLPGETDFPPLLTEAEFAPQSFGVKRAPDAPYTESVGPSVGEAQAMNVGGPSASVTGPTASAPLDALNVAAERSPWQDTVLAYYRTNLLTNPIGRAADLGSTVINQFADAAARPIAAAVDVIVSKGTGVRSITGPSLRGTGRAFGSIRQGLRDAGNVLKTGKQAIEGGADDVLYGAEVRSGLGKAVDVPINGVFRILGALDAPFRRFGYARNLFDRARVAAINEAKRGKVPWNEVTARTRELLDDGGIIKAAVRDGEAAVLSEPNKVSSWLASQTRNSPNARLAIGLVQPFMRIPLNAVLHAADFSGLGGVKAMYKIARGVGRKARGKSFFRDLEDQRIFSQNVAAGSFAPAAFILGMELQERGKMEGFYYTSKKDYPNGKVPTSVNIGGENYDINRLGGFIAAPLFVGATYNRLRKQNASKANALLRSFSGLVQTAPALGYYGVPAKAGRILTSDTPGGEIAKEAGGIASGFIPASGALGAAAKAMDSAKKREAEGFLGPVMSKIPGLRELLPEKGQGSAFVNAAVEKSRPLLAELQRLGKQIPEIRRKTKRVYQDGKWSTVNDESEDAFNARVQQFGQNYTLYGLKLLDSPRFKAAPDVVKDLALQNLYQRASGTTRREFALPEIELDANTIMDAAEGSKKNPANK